MQQQHQQQLRNQFDPHVHVHFHNYAYSHNLHNQAQTNFHLHFHNQNHQTAMQINQMQPSPFASFPPCDVNLPFAHYNADFGRSEKTQTKFAVPSSETNTFSATCTSQMQVSSNMRNEFGSQTQKVQKQNQSQIQSQMKAPKRRRSYLDRLKAQHEKSLACNSLSLQTKRSVQLQGEDEDAGEEECPQGHLELDASSFGTFESELHFGFRDTKESPESRFGTAESELHVGRKDAIRRSAKADLKVSEMKVESDNLLLANVKKLLREGYSLSKVTKVTTELLGLNETTPKTLTIAKSKNEKQVEAKSRTQFIYSSSVVSAPVGNAITASASNLAIPMSSALQVETKNQSSSLDDLRALNLDDLDNLQEQQNAQSEDEFNENVNYENVDHEVEFESHVPIQMQRMQSELIFNNPANFDFNETNRYHSFDLNQKPFVVEDDEFNLNFEHSESCYYEQKYNCDDDVDDLNNMSDAGGEPMNLNLTHSLENIILADNFHDTKMFADDERYNYNDSRSEMYEEKNHKGENLPLITKRQLSFVAENNSYSNSLSAAKTFVDEESRSLVCAVDSIECDEIMFGHYSKRSRVYSQ